MAEPALLRDLLRERHWQTYRTFCVQYDKAARTVDPSYVGTYPSRAQLHRWQSGEVKGLPYPQHCEVLEAMFPGVKAAEMFRPRRTGQTVDTEVSRNSDDQPDLVVDAGPATEPSSLEDLVRRSLAGEISDHWPATTETSLNADSAELPRPISGEQSSASAPDVLARALRQHGQRLRLPGGEIGRLAGLSGCLVDLNLDCSIEIAADGWADVEYRFEILNLTKSPMRRILREQWFETTDGPLRITPSPSCDRKVRIQRTHDTANMSKFACEVSPPIEPGEIGVIGYTTSGGQFNHDHYWRQSVSRHTRHFTLKIRHAGVEILLGCTAMEDEVDGSQVSALDNLKCDDEDGSALMTVTRDYLRPGQAVTLRWEVSRAKP